MRGKRGAASSRRVKSIVSATPATVGIGEWRREPVSRVSIMNRSIRASFDEALSRLLVSRRRRRSIDVFAGAQRRSIAPLVSVTANCASATKVMKMCRRVCVSDVCVSVSRSLAPPFSLISERFDDAVGQRRSSSSAGSAVAVCAAADDDGERKERQNGEPRRVVGPGAPSLDD